MWDPYAEFESATLPNGLTVYAAHWPGRPWEAMGFLIHSGAEHDPVGCEGLAHFVEHLVSENASISRKEMRAFFQDRGGMVSLGLTGYPDTSYRFFAPADKAILAEAFSLFGCMLCSAKLESSIERERDVVIGEFRRRYPAAFKLDLEMREQKALYAGHWLERFVTPIGTPESIGRMTRSVLQAHYDAHYTPANMSIVGVGGMPLSKLVGLLSESPFAARKQGTRTPLPVPVREVAMPGETRYVLEMSKYLTVPINVGAYRSVANIPGHISGLVVGILSEMLDDVLNDEVRERRAWTYAIGSARHNFREFRAFSITCDAFALEAVDGFEDVIEGCICSVAERKDLFEQVKRRAIAGCRMIDPTGRKICDGALDDLADKQRIVTLAEDNSAFESVTMDDVQDALQWLTPDRRWTLLIRP